MEEEVKPDLASLVADIARAECRRIYEKRLATGKLRITNLDHSIFHECAPCDSTTSEEC